MTNNKAVGYQHDLSSDNDGAIYNGDQLMPDRDSEMQQKRMRKRDGPVVINQAPAQDLNARGDRTISRLIISIMIFKIIIITFSYKTHMANSHTYHV